jgi:hypothetical protein
MSKFEELCEAFTKARNLFKEYEDECKVFARELWDKLIEYYEIPLSNISLHNVDAYGTPDKITGFDDLVLALREDGFFEFGVGFTLFETPKTFPYPHFTIVLPLNISIDRNGVYKARYGEAGKEFILDRTKDDAYQIFLDEMFKLIKSEYEDGLSNMRLQNTFRTIGFQNKE